MKNHEDRMQISSIISNKISSLATTAAVTAAENKIPNINNLLKKKENIMTRKYQTLKINILQRLIIANLGVIYFMQR